MTRRATLEEAEIAARKLAEELGSRMPDGWGFILWLMSHGPDGFCTYLSSLDRADAIAALEEWIVRQKTEPNRLDGTSSSCWCCGIEKGPLVTLRGPKRSVDLCPNCILRDENG